MRKRNYDGRNGNGYQPIEVEGEEKEPVPPQGETGEVELDTKSYKFGKQSDDRDIMHSWQAWKDELVRVFRTHGFRYFDRFPFTDYYEMFEEGLTPTEAYIEDMKAGL